MRIIIRSDSVVIEGYVNAVERNSKPLTERGITFIERVAAGAFNRALKRAKDVRILLNHNYKKDLGGIADGNLELEEDNIGLKARAIITDPEAIEEARKGNLVGWSFGFLDTPDGVTQLRDEETGLPLRIINDLELFEISLLNRQKSPAYTGTLVNVRADGSEEEAAINYARETEPENIETVNETETEKREDPKPAESEPATKPLSSETLAGYKNIIAELKAMVKTQD